MASRTRSELSQVTPVGRLSFPTLFRKRAAKGSAVEKYSTGFVLPASAKTDPKFVAIFEEVVRVGREQFGPGFDAGVKSGKYQIPFHFGGGEDKGYEPDDIYFNASSVTVRPKVVDASMQVVEDGDERVYGGVHGRISVTAFSYDNVNKGVGLGLNNVQILRPGEPFNGIRVNAEDEFSVDEDAVGDLSDLEGKTPAYSGENEPEDPPPAAEKPRRGSKAAKSAAPAAAAAGSKPLALSDLMG